MELGKDCDCGRIVYFDTVKDTRACEDMEAEYYEEELAKIRDLKRGMEAMLERLEQQFPELKNKSDWLVL